MIKATLWTNYVDAASDLCDVLVDFLAKKIYYCYRPTPDNVDRIEDQFIETDDKKDIIGQEDFGQYEWVKRIKL